MSTDSRTRYAAGLMLAAEEAGVVFAIDYGKVCEQGDVLVAVGASLTVLEPEIRKYREEIAELIIFTETEAMAIIGRMLTGRLR